MTGFAKAIAGVTGALAESERQGQQVHGSPPRGVRRGRAAAAGDQVSGLCTPTAATGRNENAKTRSPSCGSSTGEVDSRSCTRFADALAESLQLKGDRPGGGRCGAAGAAAAEVPADARRGVTQAQRNKWWDAMLGRKQERGQVDR